MYHRSKIILNQFLNKFDFYKLNLLHKRQGQSLVEYLILVAIVAVGSISVVRVIGGNLNVQLANVAQALGGTRSQKHSTYEVPTSAYKKKDLSNFFEDSVSSKASGGGRD